MVGGAPLFHKDEGVRLCDLPEGIMLVANDRERLVGVVLPPDVARELADALIKAADADDPDRTAVSEWTVMHDGERRKL